MLYGNQSISFYSRSNVTIWMTMAFQAGLLNVGGFMACQRFVSHITGFATHFGISASKSAYNDALGMLIVPLFFLFGSMLSGVLIDLRLKLNKKPRYYIAFGIMCLLLFFIAIGGTLGNFGEFSEPLEHPRHYMLLILLCLVCGIQNGTVSTVSKSVIRTTHLTGIATDLGIGIIRIVNREKLEGKIENEGKANLMRCGITFWFVAGSVAGAFLFSRLGYTGFYIPAVTCGLLFCSMIYMQGSKPAH